MENLVSMYYDKESLHIKIGEMEFIISEIGGFDVSKGSAKEINAQKRLMCSALLPSGDVVGLIKMKTGISSIQEATRKFRGKT
ncbi:hypothetical protein KAR10_03080 [bacterium]|nr:hypothetical protein [bacterium]